MLYCLRRCNIDNPLQPQGDARTREPPHLQQALMVEMVGAASRLA